MKKTGLSNNQLKLFAMAAMTVDHVGMVLFPRLILLRIIGRLAYPVFAYMIAEGCRYTKSLPKYLGTMVLLAAVCQVVYFLFTGSLYQYIPVTFSLAIGLILLLKRAQKAPSEGAWALFGMGVVAVLFITELLPLLLPWDFGVDYGFLGVMLPVLVYLGKGKWQRLLITGVMLFLLGLYYGYIQPWGLLALLPLALYNGQRGAWRLKWLFYLYFPIHLGVIYLIVLLK